MFKSLIAFCLSRRAIVVLGLLLFADAGLAGLYWELTKKNRKLVIS